jgi:hypothetical protein
MLQHGSSGRFPDSGRCGTQATVSVEQSAWTGPSEADDDANFIAIVNGLLDRLAAADEAIDVHASHERPTVGADVPTSWTGPVVPRSTIACPDGRCNPGAGPEEARQRVNLPPHP